ncbi:MAG: diacylglycerol kinase family protein [Cyclobacteriaceae bacterium]
MKRFINSFKFAAKGFRAALSGQVNLWIHLCVTLAVIIAGISFRVSATEWCVLLLCIGLVISLELINTAIEKLVDMVSPEWKEQAGLIKDIAASAVLWSSIISALIGLIIFGTHL